MARVLNVKVFFVFFEHGWRNAATGGGERLMGLSCTGRAWNDMIAS